MRKVLVVGMDGLRWDRVTAETAPTLTGLAASGALGRGILPYCEPVARSDSGPGWSTISTGTWPDKHGVVDNEFTVTRYDRHPGFLATARAAGRSTGSIVSWHRLHRHGTFEAGHRICLEGERLGWRSQDALAAATAQEWLRERGPDALFVFFGETDITAHRSGPLSAEYADALHHQDGHLAGLLAAIAERRGEEWTVIVTTDHGHLDTGGHGGPTAAERAVFLLVAGPGVPAGTVLDHARLVDVAPTVLDRLGIPLDPGLDGVPLFPTAQNSV